MQSLKKYKKFLLSFRHGLKFASWQASVTALYCLIRERHRQGVVKRGESFRFRTKTVERNESVGELKNKEKKKNKKLRQKLKLEISRLFLSFFSVLPVLMPELHSLPLWLSDSVFPLFYSWQLPPNPGHTHISRLKGEYQREYRPARPNDCSTVRSCRGCTQNEGDLFLIALTKRSNPTAIGISRFYFYSFLFISIK